MLAHDDGQAQLGLSEADVALVGVSRSSKTPTCFYLANRGIKAANVPLVPGLPEPDGLLELVSAGDRADTGASGADRDPQASAAADRKARQSGPNLVRTAPSNVDEEAVKSELRLGSAAVQPTRMAGDRCDVTIHRGDGGDGAAADGCVARAPTQAAQSLNGRWSGSWPIDLTGALTPRLGSSA